jgi:hypothetical protein
MRYTKHIHVKMDEEMYEKAKTLAQLCCEGRLGMMVRKLIEEKYEEVFGKKNGGRT